MNEDLTPSQSPFDANNTSARPFIFQVPDSIPDSLAMKCGVRELLLHRHLMEVNGRTGEFSVSLRELHVTPEVRQEERRDIYHVLRGVGSVVLDGKDHALAQGSLIVVAPKSKVSFKALPDQPLMAVH